MGQVIASIWLFCGVFLGADASAQFFTETEGLSRARLEFGVVRVVAKVSIPQPSGGAMDCSGFYVSDQAHLMLASHCLESYVFGRSQSQNRIVKDIEVDGRRGDWRVVLISPCRAEQLKENPSQMLPIENCEYYDLAILEPIRPTVAPGCVSLSAVEEPKGELVTVGYPRRTFRRSANSSGNGLHLSFGDRVDSDSCEITDSSLDRVGQRFSLEQQARQARIEGALQTSLDVFAGNSGGLVLNVDTASPVGVVSFTSIGQGFDPARERCVPGSSFISPLFNLDRAFEVMNESLPSGDPKPDLRCFERRQTLRR